MGEGDPEQPRGATRSEPVALPGDPYTGMTRRFGWLARAFGERFFSGFAFEGDDAERLRAMEQRGAIVYVMRYSSRLDYFLFNWLFLREGLRLSQTANGIRFDYYRPFGEALRLLVRGVFDRIARGGRGMRGSNIRSLRHAVREGGSAFLFLRTDKIRSQLRPTRRGALASGRSEQDMLREVVQAAAEEEGDVYLIPLALFWRKGARAQRRFLNLFYGAPQRPTDTGKVASFLWNYRNLAVRVGTPIDLGAFVAERAGEGVDRIVTKVRRSLLIFLRREEKPVAGAALRPLAQVQELVLRDAEVRAVMDDVARESGKRPDQIERLALRHLARIAANPSPTMLAVLDRIVTWIVARLFDKLDVQGLDRITDAAKQHPLVLVPCHRSHIDYLILSWLFYERHLVPPMVAAGENLAFFPLGTIFRRAGAFFLRRSFDGDPLYTALFRRYVQQLIKDGVTQEFFIEGGRSRSGRMLQPRLGMLEMVLEAFARGVRQDVYLVPVGFSYERLVEEGSMADERAGARKGRENLFALLRAGSVLRRRHGTMSLRFGEPIALSEAVGDARALLRGGAGGPSDATPDDGARRATIARVGLDVCRRLSALVTAGRSSVMAAALLATPARGVLRTELVERLRALVCVLDRLGVAVAAELREDITRGGLDSTLTLLASGDLVRRTSDPAGELVSFDESKRNLLDYYRATLSPALPIAGALALAVRTETTRGAAEREAREWLELLRLEVIPPEGSDRDRALASVLDLFHAQGWLEEAGGRLCRTADGARVLPLLEAQIRPLLEAYGAAFEAILELDGTGYRGRIDQDALRTLRRHLLVGEALFAEAATPGAIANATALLVRDGVLSANGSLREAGTQLRPGPRFGELKRWRARIASATATR